MTGCSLIMWSRNYLHVRQLPRRQGVLLLRAARVYGAPPHEGAPVPDLRKGLSSSCPEWFAQPDAQGPRPGAPPCPPPAASTSWAPSCPAVSSPTSSWTTPCPTCPREISTTWSSSGTPAFTPWSAAKTRLRGALQHPDHRPDSAQELDQLVDFFIPDERLFRAC